VSAVAVGRSSVNDARAGGSGDASRTAVLGSTAGTSAVRSARPSDEDVGSGASGSGFADTVASGSASGVAWGRGAWLSERAGRAAGAAGVAGVRADGADALGATRATPLPSGRGGPSRRLAPSPGEVRLAPSPGEVRLAPSPGEGRGGPGRAGAGRGGVGATSTGVGSVRGSSSGAVGGGSGSAGSPRSSSSPRGASAESGGSRRRAWVSSSSSCVSMRARGEWRGFGRSFVRSSSCSSGSSGAREGSAAVLFVASGARGAGRPVSVRSSSSGGGGALLELRSFAACAISARWFMSTMGVGMGGRTSGRGTGGRLPGTRGEGRGGTDLRAAGRSDVRSVEGLPARVSSSSPAGSCPPSWERNCGGTGNFRDDGAWDGGCEDGGDDARDVGEGGLAGDGAGDAAARGGRFARGNAGARGIAGITGLGAPGGADGGAEGGRDCTSAESRETGARETRTSTSSMETSIGGRLGLAALACSRASLSSAAARPSSMARSSSFSSAAARAARRSHTSASARSFLRHCVSAVWSAQETSSASVSRAGGIPAIGPSATLSENGELGRKVVPCAGEGSRVVTRAAMHKCLVLLGFHTACERGTLGGDGAVLARRMPATRCVNAA
jgi:hypothetical protein